MSTDGPFHLGWFTGNGVGMYGWNVPWGASDARDFFRPDFWRDIVRALERAKFDIFIIEDSTYVPNNYGDSHDLYLRHGLHTPKPDPAPYVPLLAEATAHIGITLTGTTTEYPPYLLARLISTLDFLSDGRVGWNMVTGSNNLSGQNYGLDALPEHDQRYAMAQEYVEVVTQLLASWEPGSLILDRDAGVVADPDKVRPIDYAGTYYRSRGPLNGLPSPQGRPVYVQAGGSPAGRDFAARNADVVINNDRSIPVMKAYADDIRARLVEHGRKPDDCKILFMLSPFLAETQEEAQLIYQRSLDSARQADPALRLASISAKAMVDFSQFDLDEPLPELHTNGHQATLKNFLRAGGAEVDGTRTLREMIAASVHGNSSLDVIGTPDAVAAQMGEVMAEVGGDGYLLSSPKVTRRYVAEITDGLVPALQKRGLSRTEYSATTLRGNMFAF
jgi:FMN-dependent oxidoreductase (nitrilotriacetate monooxygenase family)